MSTFISISATDCPRLALPRMQWAAVTIPRCPCLSTRTPAPLKSSCVAPWAGSIGARANRTVWRTIRPAPCSMMARTSVSVSVRLLRSSAISCSPSVSSYSPDRKPGAVSSVTAFLYCDPPYLFARITALPLPPFVKFSPVPGGLHLNCSNFVSHGPAISCPFSLSRPAAPCQVPSFSATTGLKV